MRQLKVDLEELATAFESHFDELSNYLDLETGELVVVTDDTSGQLEALYEQMPVEEGTEAPALADLLAAENWPDWQKQMVLQADAVERGYGERFIRIPEVDSHDAYDDMEEFIDTVRRPHLRELLEVAIRGRGAFPPLQGRAAGLSGRAGAVVRVPGREDARTGARVVGSA